jgi:PrgI family protein
MTPRQHEIPTHLNVEDKLVFGLTARQFLYVLVGCTLAYAVWDQASIVPAALRVGVATACLLVSTVIALVRPSGRALEEWLLAALIFCSTPRRCTWQAREPEAADWRPALAGWQELTPNLIWAEDESR